MEKVRRPLGLESMPDSELLDHLPQFLEDVVHFLTDPLESPGMVVQRLGGAHGRHRFAVGFNLKEVIQEYEALLDVIAEMVKQYQPKVELEGWRRLNAWLFAGVKEAVASYGKARDLQLDHQATEHMAFLAHELRNPLTSVSLALQILGRRLPPGGDRALEVMETNLQRVRELIDDQLLEVRLRLGIVPTYRPLEARSFLEEIVAALESNASTKHQSIVIRETDEAIDFEADPRLLRSVLLNLVGNAIKFSHEGATIQLRTGRDAHHVLFGVEDRCGGLPAGQADKFFDAFTQFGRDRSGEGLGLAIAKQATEAHHGTIHVHNLRGIGCEMIVELPLSAPKKGAQARK